MRSDVTWLTHAIIGLLTWFAIIGAFQFVLLPSLVERFRQRIFFLRREMFLLLLNTPMRPDEPAYTHLRSAMNGMLRVAERLTLARLLLHGVLFRKQTQAYAQKLQAELAQIENPMIRDQLAIFRVKLGQEIIRHVVTISPIAWLFFVVASPILFIFLCLRGLQSLSQLGRRSLAILAEQFSVQGMEAQAEALVIRA